MSLSAGSWPRKREPQQHIIEIGHEDENYQDRKEASQKIIDAVAVLNHLRKMVGEEVPGRFGDQAESFINIVDGLYTQMYKDLKEDYDTINENTDEILNPYEELTYLGNDVLDQGPYIVRKIFLDELNIRAGEQQEIV